MAMSSENVQLERWVGVREYAELNKMSQRFVTSLCEQGLLNAVQPNGKGSHWRICLRGANTVSRAEYDEILRENERLKETLNSVKALLTM